MDTLISNDSNHTIIVHDAIDYIAGQDLQSDLIITSPPYNLDIDYGSYSSDNNSSDFYFDWSYHWLELLYRKVKKATRLCVNIPLDVNKPEKIAFYHKWLSMALIAGWKYNTTIIWNEQNISRRTAWGSYCLPSAPNVIAPVEMIIVLYKSPWKLELDYGYSHDITSDNFIAWTNGIWTFNGEKKSKVGGHPAAFPEELVKRLILLYSKKKSHITDIFAGSGTVGAVAAKLGRVSSSIEINRDYATFAMERINNALK